MSLRSEFLGGPSLSKCPRSRARRKSRLSKNATQERFSERSEAIEVPKISRQENIEVVKTTSQERISERSQVYQSSQDLAPGECRGRKYPSVAYF